MKRFILLTIIILVLCSCTMWGYSLYPPRGPVLTFLSMPSIVEVGEYIDFRAEFIIQREGATFESVVRRHHEYVRINVHRQQVLRDIGSGNIVVVIQGSINISSPGMYYLRLFGVKYKWKDNTYQSLLSAQYITAKPVVQVSTDVPIKTICLGQPLLYVLEAETDVEDVQFRYGQSVVRKSVQQTKKGYRIKAWLNFTESGKYKVQPVAIRAERQIYKPDPIKVSVVPIRARLSFPRRAIKVGEPLKFKIELTPLQDGIVIERHLNQWNQFKVSLQVTADNKRYVLRGQLRLFEATGREYLLGPIGVRYKEDGETKVAYLSPIPIWLQRTVTSDAYQLKAMYFGEDVNMLFWDSLVLSILAFLGILALIQVIRFIRDRKVEEPEPWRERVVEVTQQGNLQRLGCLLKELYGKRMQPAPSEAQALTTGECGELGFGEKTLEVLRAIDIELFSEESSQMSCHLIDPHNLIEEIEEYDSG